MSHHDDPKDPDEPGDEIDVGRTSDPVRTPPRDPSDTLPEGIEFLGTYATITEYLRAVLEPEVSAGCAWLLDHVDYAAVRRRWESDESRLVIERGHVYRISPGALR